MAEPFASADALSLPFDQAIEFFRDKIDLPTERWTDLWQGQHSRAFVVAGAMRGDLLADIHSAVLKGLEKGTTLAEFRKDFDAILDRTGWQPRGGRAWRAGVIYRTNLSTAYAAGHYKRMTDPDVARARPFWRYVESSAAEPRPEHQAWAGVVLPHDDPWWDTHYPPNDWGCECSVVSHSATEVERLKAEGARIVEAAPDDGTYEWKNPATGEVVQVPKGVGPGWAYNPGETAWGKQLSEKAMGEWEAGKDKWEQLTPGDWRTAGRPERVPVDEPRAALGQAFASVEDATRGLTRIIGGEEATFGVQAKDFRYDVLVDAASLAEHVALDRSPFFPFLPEALEDPSEIWVSFERHTGTGKVELRQRIIKAVKVGKDRTILAVAQANKGQMEAWTVIPTGDLKYVNRQRRGRLAWSRPD
jgi:hypothetical protein